MSEIFGIEITKISIDGFEKNLSLNQKNFLEENKFLKKNIYILLKFTEGNKDLSVLGRHFIMKDILGCLNRKIKLTRIYEIDKECINTRIHRPVFIVTLPRTGSTFLHSLLAQDKRWKVPEYWELLRPGYRSDPLSAKDLKEIDDVNQSLASLDAIGDRKGLKACHHVTATDPEDLLNIYITDGIYELPYYFLKIPGLEDHYRNFTFEEYVQVYKNVKKNLELIGMFQNLHERRFMNMHHLGSFINVPALLEVFPDAQIVMIHRDVKKVIPSITSYYYYVAKYLTKPNIETKQRICDVTTDVILKSIKEIKNWRNDPIVTSPSSFERVVDINFNNLVKDPIKVLKDLYKKLDMDYTDDCHKCFQNYLQINKERIHHNYVNVKLDEERIENESEDYTRKYVNGE